MKQIREITHPGSNRARLWPQAGGPRACASNPYKCDFDERPGLEGLGDLVEQEAILSLLQRWLPAPYSPLGSGQKEMNSWKHSPFPPGGAILRVTLPGVLLCPSRDEGTSGDKAGTDIAEVLGRAGRCVDRTGSKQQTVGK